MLAKQRKRSWGSAVVTTYCAPADSLCAALELCRNLAGHQSWCRGRCAHLAVSWNIFQWTASRRTKAKSSRGSASAGVGPLYPGLGPGRFASQSRGEQLKICYPLIPLEGMSMNIDLGWYWYLHILHILHILPVFIYILYAWLEHRTEGLDADGPLKCADEDC